MSASGDTFILIRNATVLSVDLSIGELKNADILIHNDRIEDVGRGLQQPPGHVTVIDGRGCIVTPGFVDGHHHMWQQLIRGIATDWSLFDYLVSIRSVYGSLFTAEDVYLANYAAALSLLNNGVTSVLEHCHIINSPAHADAAIKGIKDAGIRATFCYGLYENYPLDGASTEEFGLLGFDEAARESDLHRARHQHFGRNDPSDEVVTFGVATDEPEALPIEETLWQIAKAREEGARIITMHVAMGPCDVAHRQIVQQLADAGAMGPDLVFSHGASLTDSELEAIRTSGAGVVGTPDTELQMGMGFPVVFKAADRGCHTCLGLDITSNQGNDFIAQMRLALQAQRAQENESSVLINRKTADVLRMGTMGGAEVMRLDHITGSVTPGKKADLILFRCDDIDTVPVADSAASVVFHSSSKQIDTVIVNGRIVKRDGHLTGVDWPDLRENLIRQSGRIKQQAMTGKLSRASRERWASFLGPLGQEVKERYGL